MSVTAFAGSSVCPLPRSHDRQYVRYRVHRIVSMFVTAFTGSSLCSLPRSQDRQYARYRSHDPAPCPIPSLFNPLHAIAMHFHMIQFNN
jgi:uncharacterized protein YcsI (UPF0317 family)